MEMLLSIIAIIFCISLSVRLSRVENVLSEKLNKMTEDSPKKDFEKEKLKGKEVIEVCDKEAPFITWIKTDWLMKLGAFLLLLGFGWLVTYAFMNDWIGPIGRISFGLVSGVLILTLGEWRIKSFRNQGAVLIGLGATIDLLTIFAAREIYNFFDPLTALIVMAVIVVFVGLSSIKNKSLSVAVLGLVLGGIAPLLTNTVDPTFLGLFSYLFVLSLGILWVIKVTGWRVLSLLSLILVFIYSIPYFIPYMSRVEDTNIAIISAFSFAGLFYLANITAVIFTKKSTVSDLITSGLNAFLLLLWINTVIPTEWQSIVTVITALIFVLGAFLVFDKTKLKEAMFLYSGVAIVFIAAAAAFELSGAALTIAYTIQAGAIVLLSDYLFKDSKLNTKLTFLFIVPIMMAFESIDSGFWRLGVFHKDFFVLLILLLVFYTLGLCFYKQKKSSHKLMLFNFIAGIFYSLVLIWQSIFALIENSDTASMVVLIIYTIIGLYFYIRNRFKKNKFFRILGSVLLAMVVVRLLTVEVWNMSITGKIITFFSIGSLLISTAFIGNKKKLKD